MTEKKILKRSIQILLLYSLMTSSIAWAMNVTNDNVIQKLLVDEANRQGIKPELVLAIAEVESNFNPNALSQAGARGVMQIMPRTAEKVFGISASQLYEAKVNINLGVSFIKKLLSRYDQRLDIALSHYNGGSAVQDNFGRLSVIPATQTYVNKVIAAQEKFTYKAYLLSTTVATQPLNNHDQKFFVAEPYGLKSKTGVKLINPIKQQKPRVKALPSVPTVTSSWHQKVEKLRSLRVHNVMRNTPKESIPKIPSSERKQLTKNKAFSAPLSEKQMKILRWEAIFN